MFVTPHDPTVVVNPRNNSLVEFVTRVISSALKLTEIRDLERSPGEWSPTYITILTRIYMTLIEEQSIRVAFARKHLIEPIVLYEPYVNVEACYEKVEKFERHQEAKKRRRRRQVEQWRRRRLNSGNASGNFVGHDGGDTNGGRVGDYDSADDSEESEVAAIAPNVDRLLHIFSIEYIINYFTRTSPFQCTTVQRQLVEVQLPQMFVLKTNPNPDSNYRLSDELTNNLLRLYVLADHAATHYFEYVHKGTIQYSHDRPPQLAILERLPYAFFNLITPRPSSDVQRLLTVSTDLEGRQDLTHPYPHDRQRRRHHHDDDDDDITTAADSTRAQYPLYVGDAATSGRRRRLDDVVDCIEDRFKTRYIYNRDTERSAELGVTGNIKSTDRACALLIQRPGVQEHRGQQTATKRNRGGYHNNNNNDDEDSEEDDDGDNNEDEENDDDDDFDEQP